MGRSPIVLVVSDDAVLRELLRGLLVRERIRAIEVDSPDEALAICREERPALLVIDSIVETDEVSAFLGRIAFARSEAPPPVLLLAGSGCSADVARHEAVSETLYAPFAAPALVAAVRRHLASGTGTSHTRLRAALPGDDGLEKPKASSGDDE